MTWFPNSQVVMYQSIIQHTLEVANLFQKRPNKAFIEIYRLVDIDVGFIDRKISRVLYH